MATALALAGTGRAKYRPFTKALSQRGTTGTSANSLGTFESGLRFAHIRSSTGTPVQQSNCHPFRHGKWLWMHNGSIARFQEVKRELVLAVDPALYADIEGSTDSEMFFFLALTFGLAHDPPVAVERAVGFIERVGRKHGIEHPIQMTVAAMQRPGSCGPSATRVKGDRVHSFTRPKHHAAGAVSGQPDASTAFQMKRG